MQGHRSTHVSNQPHHIAEDDPGGHQPEQSAQHTRPGNDHRSCSPTSHWLAQGLTGLASAQPTRSTKSFADDVAPALQRRPGRSFKLPVPSSLGFLPTLPPASNPRQDLHCMNQLGQWFGVPLLTGAIRCKPQLELAPEPICISAASRGSMSSIEGNRRCMLILAIKTKDHGSQVLQGWKVHSWHDGRCRFDKFR